LGQLKREVGIFGAMMMGLGSIVGTGVFVSIGIAAGVTGPSVIAAIGVAAVVATCNGLSSAQLAANHPVSGGTYEYGYRWLHPSLGFTAGWMFLCAKSASAATAALGFAGYTLNMLGWPPGPGTVTLAVSVVVLMTLLVLTGIRRSNRTNIIIVTVTLLSLGCFIVAGMPLAWQNRGIHLTPFFASPTPTLATRGFLEACALMFVAFTGYGRIATLGEEVMQPRTTIPKAIIVTLAVASLLYVAVAFVATSAAGAGFLAAATGKQAAPLEAVARQFGYRYVAPVVAAGAVTAMLGVLLNLILGLSRVALAMGRRRDLPAGLARIHPATSTPHFAVAATGMLIAMLTLIGDVKTTWSFSAFTVLVYYALTNLAALRLSANERLYPATISWLGLAACLSLSFWVDFRIWVAGLLCLLAGLGLRAIFRRLPGPRID
jgi:APA family basic amino acid/polyamine antiporter